MSAPAVQWRLVLDGERADWPTTKPTASIDSLQVVGQRLLSQLRQAGHYYATLDSAVVDTSAQPASVRIYAHRGPKVRIETLRIKGTSAMPSRRLRGLMDTDQGELLRPDRLEADIQALLDRYEDAGYPLAQIRVAETRLSTDDGPALQVTLRVSEGPKLWLKRIDVPNDARTSPELLARLAGLEIGQPLRSYDPAALRRRLQNKPLFRKVGAPKLRVGADGGAVLRVPIEESSPGAFDFVLGYLPPSRTRDSGQLVGNGHLLLKNIFGGGRTAEFTLDRRPGRTSVFDVAVSDPYLLGLPLRAEGQFRGEQRDSTYNEQTYSFEIGYRLGGGVEITGSLNREVVRPGPAGARLRNDRQRIPRSTTFFYGVGVRYQAIDRPQNPRQGVSVDLQLSQGRKRRRVRRVVPGGDTTRTTSSVRQERLHARVRAYLPLAVRQVIAVGGEGAILLSPDGIRDRSDLFRLGGAASLRGYNEDRFLGNVVARGLAEYRFQFDPGSYAYAFVDLGYVARPALGSTSAAHGWHPGYGVGVRLRTAIGRITTTYALNPNVQSPSNGRVHLGLSVGL
ncbi:MAG: outer membrane protein assembly factor [Salinibacter sp.]|uniref:outer membrane protein assembly factor n=1 Tax=Salinibacter sp. TaxID=2065818 RepID=UPI0035D4AA9F